MYVRYDILNIKVTKYSVNYVKFAFQNYEFPSRNSSREKSTLFELHGLLA